MVILEEGYIIIRDQNGPKIPFDIAHLRFIEYDNTPTGLKRLASNLKDYFEQFESDPDRLDNEMLEELGLNRSHNGKEMIKVSSPLLYALAIGHNKPESLSMQFPLTFINNSNTPCIIQDLRLILEQNNNQSNELYFANSKSSMNNHESLLAQQFAIESNRTYSAAFFFHRSPGNFIPIAGTCKARLKAKIDDKWRPILEFNFNIRADQNLHIFSSNYCEAE